MSEAQRNEESDSTVELGGRRNKGENMEIVLSKSECLDDWYTIVRAKHDGREWFKRTSPNSMRLMCSERLTPEACIEGSSVEMIAIAIAIKNRKAVSFKRCAVHFAADGAHFHSPKNSERDAVVPVESADAFAAQVLAELTPNAEVTGVPKARPVD